MHHLVENCCENYTDDPKDTKLIDEIANTLSNETNYLKNKSAMEKCLDLAKDPNSDPIDDAVSADLFIPDMDPAPNLMITLLAQFRMLWRCHLLMSNQPQRILTYLIWELLG